ncbi:MAG: arylsulfatase [Planctomycetaceae bacterium]
MSCLVWGAGHSIHGAEPNVLVILTDDQGWGDLSLHGNTNLNTPNIDRLASEGAVFERFYVCPVCSPTRAEFLTGRYHVRGGVYSTSAGGERVDLDETTIADTFRAAEYRTAAYGKWHNGMQFPYHPNARGFDDFYGFCSGHWGNYWNPMLEHNGEIVQGKGFIIDDLTDHAISRIQEPGDQPFFIYLPLNTPHSPMQVPDRWWSRFREFELRMHNRDQTKEDPDHIRAALAMCENIDWNVGRLLEALESTDRADNTIVVYFCDNGPNGVRWNGDMKGRKGSTDEGGVRSPCIMRWPGKIPAGTVVRENGAAIDLHPTLAALAGIPTVNPATHPFDGIDLSAAVQGQSLPAANERVIMSHWNKRVSARSNGYCLDNDGKLFHLPTDPGQRSPVNSQHPETAARLQEAVRQFRKVVMPGFDDDHRPFVIAHPEAKTTQLPARDAVAHGNIQRSNRFPNSSYFTNWTSPDDRITWDAEVLATGDYDVRIFYTCQEADAGADIRLSFNDEQLNATVGKAHPSELVGAAEDRVVRSESYEQNWGILEAGTIHLNAGKGLLTLQATKIPGNKVMDFRLLLLNRRESREFGKP